MNCIRIAALQFGVDTDAEDIMMSYADSTCGWYAQTTGSDPSAIMEMILTTIHEDLPECGESVIEGLPDCSL